MKKPSINKNVVNRLSKFFNYIQESMLLARIKVSNLCTENERFYETKNAKINEFKKFKVLYSVSPILNIIYL